MIREITHAQVAEAVREAFLEACLAPPPEVDAALRAAIESESSERARGILGILLENNSVARAEGVASCQDTGMAVVFADVGQDVHISGDFESAVNEGVRRAYEDGYLRKSVLSPLLRKNTGDNTPAVIHTRLVPGDRLTVTAAPKGFGSENMSRIAMLKPSDGEEGLVRFLVDSAREAGGMPCPPVVLGVGIGGTFEYAALLAKRQLLRTIGRPSEEPRLAALEERVRREINALGMGPMGLGGDTYCLAVHMAEYPTHLAGLPVAVNYCCHALRHAERTI